MPFKEKFRLLLKYQAIKSWFYCRKLNHLEPIGEPIIIFTKADLNNLIRLVENAIINQEEWE